MFDEKSLSTLEYGKILEMLAAFAQSEGGKSRALEIRPYTTLEEAEHALNLTAEADRVLFEFSVSPSFAVDDISEILLKAEKGAVLAIPELLKVGRALRVARRLVKSLSKVINIPLLSEMSTRLYFEEELEKDIFDAFISETEVADNATPELKAIRQRIRRLGDGVKTKLQTFITSPAYHKYLQDSIVTVRGDRYVIPVKSEFKGAISGLVHDQSASGATLYIEPMQIVELNNELKTEKLNEQAEIERILRNFSTSVRAHCDRLNWSYEVMVDMDLIFARAQLAHAQKATRPDLNREGELTIKEGRHPLIDAKKVVPLTLGMKSGENMLLITGPNTGGKTVTLKMVGLFVLMAMSGFYIPAKSANICIVDGVYSDIGDEQSIEQSLSTFSAHIKNIIGILDRITPQSLVLFDELGAGTDPGEGAALAVSICEYVMGLGAKALVTSHFNDLKEFALTTKGVVAASMEFDTATFRPTFRLVMGAIGTSNALDIASTLGLNKDIVANARNKISAEKKQFDSVLSAAEQTRRYAEKLVSDASLDREKAASALREAENQKKVIAEKREKLDESIRRETKLLIENSVEEADEILEQLREMLDKEVVEDKDIFAARALKRKLQNMSAKYDKESVVEDEPDNSPLKDGDPVWVKSLSKRGTLVRRNSRGEADVAFGKLTVKVKSGDYYKVK
ncbi:MAG: endonuclease MutS2 [Acutalibacteraceae bacterium]